MLNCSSCAGKPLPEEYREMAEALFPNDCSCKDSKDASAKVKDEVMLAFADNLGVGADYRKLNVVWNNQPELEKFFHSFQNNLDLLIQKTWVEKADEDRKEKLLDQIPGLMKLIKEENYAEALGEFGIILEELAWLLFGSQSRGEDFFEYVFRIDLQLGLFWWYGGQLERFLASGSQSKDVLKPVLFLGLCYLTDF